MSIKVIFLSLRFPWHSFSPNATSGRRKGMVGKGLKKMWMNFRSSYAASLRQHLLGLWPAVLPIKVVMRCYCTWLNCGTTGSNTEIKACGIKYVPSFPCEYSYINRAMFPFSSWTDHSGNIAIPNPGKNCN